MSDRWKQKLVGAQIEINRAVFLMNAQMARKSYHGLLTPAEYSREAIKKHIRACIADLRAALE